MTMVGAGLGRACSHSGAVSGDRIRGGGGALDRMHKSSAKVGAACWAPGDASSDLEFVGQGLDHANR